MQRDARLESAAPGISRGTARGSLSSYSRPAATIRWRNCFVRSSRGALEELLGSPCLEDPPCVEEADPMGDVAREAHLVRRDQHRHAAGRELADDVEHLGDELGVERARDLVEEQQPWLHRERAHDRDPLLLAAREAVRVLVALVREPEPLEQPRRLLVRRAAGEAARLARRERHVLAHRHVREEVEGLEDDPDPATDAVDVDTAGGDLLAAHRDPPRVDRLEQVDAAQEGRLPRAGRADQAHDLVLGEREIDAAEHLELAERLVDALDEQRLPGDRLRRRAHASLPACWRLRSRATSQSVKRASGIVIATNSVAATR